METIDEETLAAAKDYIQRQVKSGQPFLCWWTGVTLNGIVSHEDWLPTLAAAAGNPNIKQQLANGTSLNGRQYRNYIDGHNQLDYLSGKVDKSPRSEFFYVNDDGQIVAIRYADWKVVFLENRGESWQGNFCCR